MTINSKITLLLLVLFTACKDGKEYLFFISEPNGEKNDFLFMAESSNVPEIKSDSLSYYLTNEEILAAEKLKFKKFGVILNNEKEEIKNGNSKK